MTIRFRGVTEVTNNMRRSSNGAYNGSVSATRALAKEVLAESKALVPVETGALKASGRLQERGGMHRYSVTIAYGARDQRNSARYAVYVHEDLNATHVTGTAKFIEIPWVRIMGKALATYRVLVGRAIERSVR